MDDFVQSTEGTNITIISQEIFQHDPEKRVENLKVLSTLHLHVHLENLSSGIAVMPN